ncbi:hypothetical protein H632_c4995p0, partial [Helicosporidium sp. ATCC 50920]
RPKDRILSLDPSEVTAEMVTRKLAEVALSRGKASRGDRAEQREMLSHLELCAKTPAQRARVLTAKITLLFDMSQPNMAPMSTGNWYRCADTLLQLLQLVREEKGLILTDVMPDAAQEGEDGDEKDEGGESGRDAKKDGDEAEVGGPKTDGLDTSNVVWCNPVAFFERLDDEWTVALKALDPHANEYMERLRDETLLLALAQRVSESERAAGRTDRLATVA